MEKFYKGYFQNLQAQSKRLKSFFYINDKYNLAAFDDAVRSAAFQTPAILLEQYDYEVEDQGSRNYMKGIQGQFTILSKTTKGNQSTIEDARVNGEIIADLMVARMRRDFESGQKITLADSSVSNTIYFKRVKAKISAVGPINADYYGVTCVFSWDLPFTVQVTSDEWNDVT